MRRQGVRDSQSQGMRETRSQGVRETQSQGVRETRSQGLRETRSQGMRETHGSASDASDQIDESGESAWESARAIRGQCEGKERVRCEGKMGGSCGRLGVWMRAQCVCTSECGQCPRVSVGRVCVRVGAVTD